MAQQVCKKRERKRERERERKEKKGRKKKRPVRDAEAVTDERAIMVTIVRERILTLLLLL